jgi:hypothetical protein
LPAAVAEAATAEGVVVSTEEVSAVAVSTGAAFMVVGSAGEASAVALSTAVVVSTGDVSPVAVSMAVAFVAAVLVGATGVATGAITDSLMMSSSAASVFLEGGAGAIRTDITVTTITRTITMAMDTAGTRTITTVTAGTVTTVARVMDMAAERVMDIAMAAEPVMDTAMATDQRIPGVSGGGDRPGCGSLKSLAC